MFVLVQTEVICDSDLQQSMSTLPNVSYIRAIIWFICPIFTHHQILLVVIKFRSHSMKSNIYKSRV